MPDDEHPRNNLNSLCLRIHKTCSFEMSCENPRTHMAEHLAICKINDIEYGRGCGRNIKEAKNAAAHVALKALRQEYPGLG